MNDAAPIGSLSLQGFFKGDREATVSLKLPSDLFAEPTPEKPREKTSRSGRRSAKSLETKLPAIGSVIEKYRIEELLGTGGFSVVYRAMHMLLRLPVCIKMLKPKIVNADPKLAKLLCEEARFTALLNHPNVVRVMDVTHSEALTYIVMEYVDGQTLAAAIHSKKRLNVRDVARIGIDVCRGLKAALAQGLIHRDIKPANILLTKDGTAKIVDLGLAHRIRTAPMATADTAIRAGSVVGTPLYMAPEQASHPEKVDFRSDIYSLGVTLYHALTGKPPFSGENAAQIIHMHQIGEIKEPDVSPAAANVLMRMLAKRPDDRYQSYDELCDALAAAK